MRWIWVVLGVFAVVLGAVWTLQGLDVLGGSAMSGNTFWAVVGPVLAIVGLVLVALGLRRRRPSA